MTPPSDDARTRQVLRDHGLPPGLLPPGITQAEIAADGRFTVHLPRTVERTHGGYRVRYGTHIHGRITTGQVSDLHGVEAKKGLWIRVARIDAVGGALEFHVGPVRQRLGLHEFPD